VLWPLNLGRNTGAAPDLTKRAERLQLHPVLPAALALAVEQGADFVTSPLVTRSSRTIREFARCLPTARQAEDFRLACQKLALEFGGYSTNRTSVLFTVKPKGAVQEQVIVAIHPSWSEVDETGVPFEASPQLIAERTGHALAIVKQRLANFPEFPFRSAGCRLICGPQSVDVLVRLVHLASNGPLDATDGK
jgi:hypothetical protein